ncbi:CHAT domain-containing protein [Pseudanabaena mucicola]|uniref:CHAT domain-containing protein n=1 Tax=Pseudanabaena mucicola FACHB-723 TaxID=2692860 RepID=A0ABR7ZUP5_9CYAN|nr:CHAT domain-containing protein [Pseudanabaena mucicola]MBD2187706.1 CHAT domain-containing protein [Pseudanabaena mucicola FACHB-723]
MKKRSLIWKTGLAIAIGVTCMVAPSVQRSIAQYPPEIPSSSSSDSQSIQPPFVFPQPPQTSPLCDRLTNTICNPTSVVTTTTIETVDKKVTQEVCEYTGSCESTPTVTLSFVQDLLRQAEKVTESNTALIYPNIFSDRLEILVVPSSGKEIRKVVRNNNKSGKADIDETVLDLLSAIRDPNSEDYLQPSQKLYQLLISPIEQDLEVAEVKTLIFVLDGSLRSVPIAALHDGEKFLVQKYAMATVPSMALVNLQIPDRRRNSILAMGLTEEMQGFSEIPNVATEIDTITSKILNGKVFLNKDFTIANLVKEQQQGNYGIVHLATHAQFLSPKIDGAFIQLWNERLSLEQLRTLQVGQEAIEMLTLSACQTAVGQNLGLSGVAIIYRAKSVLASLWEVDDAGTTPLMLDFYRNYPTSKSKAIALQNAQIAMIEGNVRVENQQIVGIPQLAPVQLANLSEDIDLKHPYFWSSFILVGNWL